MPFKTCENCKEKCAPRLRRCKKCDFPFVFKVKKKKNSVSTKVNWQELANGDYIKVTSGPVWLSKDKTEIPMGYSGVFVVVGLDENGILAQGKDRTSGFCHIWMGKEILNDVGILKRPHRIAKINMSR